MERLSGAAQESEFSEKAKRVSKVLAAVSVISLVFSGNAAALLAITALTTYGISVITK